MRSNCSGPSRAPTPYPWIVPKRSQQSFETTREVTLPAGHPFHNMPTSERHQLWEELSDYRDSSILEPQLGLADDTYLKSYQCSSPALACSRERSLASRILREVFCHSSSKRTKGSPSLLSKESRLPVRTSTTLPPGSGVRSILSTCDRKPRMANLSKYNRPNITYSSTAAAPSMANATTAHSSIRLPTSHVRSQTGSTSVEHIETERGLQGRTHLSTTIRRAPDSICSLPTPTPSREVLHASPSSSVLALDRQLRHTSLDDLQRLSPEARQYIRSLMLSVEDHEREKMPL